MKKPELSDELLAARIIDADNGALSDLVNRHYNRIYRHAYRITGQVQNAEDIVQDIFLKLCSGTARFDPARGALLPWLLRITTNACLDAKRALKPVSDISAAEHVPDQQPGPHDNAESRAVHMVIAQLPPRQRAAIALFYIEGFSMAEVAQALDTNSKAVEGLLLRGKAAMQTSLNPALPEGFAA